MMKNYIFLPLLFLALFLLCAGSICCAQDAVLKQVKELSFNDFLNRVSRHNLPYLAAQYQVQLADAELLAARVFPDPTLAVEGADAAYSIAAGYNLELGHKRQARQQLAQSKLNYENAALIAYFQDLRADAAASYLEAHFQQALLDVKSKAYAYMLQLSRSDSVRFKLGDLAETDARQSKVEAIILRNAVFEQEGLYQSVLVTMNQFMGHMTDTLIIPQGDLSAAGQAYNLLELLSLGLKNRQDLIASQQQIDVATKAQSLLKAERKVDLDLILSYEQNPRAYVPTVRALKLGVVVPLKFSNSNRGRLHAAQYAIAQSMVQSESKETQIRAEITQSYYLFEAQKKIRQQYTLGLLSASHSVMEGMIYKYKRGESSIMEVLIAQRTFNAVQQQYLESEKAYALARVNLQKACGIWDIDF